MRRLFETGRLLIDCCAEQGALRPGREGWRSAVRVRALHARVRRRLLLRGASGGEAWDCARDGVPINQEDQAVTLLAFSYNVLAGLELIRGGPVPGEEERAYLHLWRWVGRLLGLRDELNPCRAGMPLAKATLESIVLHLLHPDALSVRVAHHLLRAPRSSDAAFERSASMTRLLVGDELGDALELPWSLPGRRRARWALLVLRTYGALCCSTLFGGPLCWLHRSLMRAVQRAEGVEIFVGRRPELQSASRCGGGGGSSSASHSTSALGGEVSLARRVYSIVRVWGL